MNEEGTGSARENQDYQFWVELMFWQQTLLDPQEAGTK